MLQSFSRSAFAAALSIAACAVAVPVQAEDANAVPEEYEEESTDDRH
jgi:hypothetical protein